jgi:hypothetical protein
MIDKRKETYLGSWVRHEFDFDKALVVIFIRCFFFVLLAGLFSLPLGPAVTRQLVTY